MIRKIIIAIDGHSSTGKSTLAKMLSKHLMYKHINTGSMYRALTLHALRNAWIDNSRELKINKHKIIESIDALNLDFQFDEQNACRMCINNEDVDDLLKDPLVSQYVSVISAYPLVRKKIVKIQQELGKTKGVVMEGRDIGSVVFPEAELKLFITASLEVRAKRRHQELIKLGIQASLKDVLHNLKMRDSSDSNRKNSPLICVKDAVLIDNTLLNIDMQFNMVVDLLKNKINLL
tara:strand:+ start:326 stop:1027 length:702 start_codon:yes stop_codon:yes gene_type:complete